MAHKLLKEALNLRWLKLQKELAKCCQKADVEAIHDLRVSIRRFNAAIDAIDFLHSNAGVRKTKKELKKLMRPLGNLRDLHVQREWLLDLFRPADCAGINQYLIRLTNKEGKIANKIMPIIRHFKPQQTASFVEEYLQNTDHDWPATKVRSGIAGYLLKLYEELLSWETAATSLDDTVGTHKMRIAFKRYRYACEVALPFMRRSAKAEVAHLQTYQNLLGQIHDLDVLHEKLSAFSEKAKRTEWEKTDLQRALDTLCLKKSDLRRQFVSQFAINKERINVQRLLLAPSTLRRKLRLTAPKAT